MSAVRRQFLAAALVSEVVVDVQSPAKLALGKISAS